MAALDAVRERLPAFAKDVRVNLQAAIDGGALDPIQRWGVLVASAAASRNRELLDAIVADARAAASEAAVEDGLAAAVMMGMNNVYYRFRHMIGKPSYSSMPARLRMQRIAQVATNKAAFELMCLAVSAINGCETCVKAHEQTVLAAGLGEEHVHDAVRLAAIVTSAAVALEAA
jgi:lipoyl-dependent peroxiredoxin subunit D